MTVRIDRLQWAMGDVKPEIVYVKGDGSLMRPNASGFNRPFGRANEEQKARSIM